MSWIVSDAEITDCQRKLAIRQGEATIPIVGSASDRLWVRDELEPKTFPIRPIGRLYRSERQECRLRNAGRKSFGRDYQYVQDQHRLPLRSTSRPCCVSCTLYGTQEIGIKSAVNWLR